MAWLASAAGTNSRPITISGMRLDTWAYQEITKNNPLDDLSLALSASAELSILCYSTWYPYTEWNIFAHVPMVTWPNIWYYPMSTSLGSWPLQAGDNLVCELWECDGGVGGCDPSVPSILPNATAGDDKLGELSMGMADFKSQLTLTTTFNASASSAVASVMMECDDAWQLWHDNDGAWVNPYRAGEMPPSMRYPLLDIVPSPPTTVSAFDGPQEASSPSPPSPPPADVKGGGIATGVVAAIGAVGGLLALLAVVTVVYCARKGKCCFGRGKVTPEAPADTESQEGETNLHISVKKPAHAVPLMRAAHASAATVYTPWAPDLTLDRPSDP